MIITFTSVMNITFALIILVFTIIIKMGLNEEVRLMPGLARTSRPIFDIPHFAIGFTMSAINFYVVFIAINYQLPQWPYYIFAFYYAINYSLEVFKKLKLKIKSKREHSEIPILNLPVLITDPLGNTLFQILSLFLGLIFLYSASLSLIYLFKIMPQKNIVLAVKTSLELIAFILLLLYMLRQFFNQMQMKFLGAEPLPVVKTENMLI